MTDEANGTGYKLSLTGPGVTISQNVDQVTAAAVVQLVLGGTPAGVGQSGRSAGGGRGFSGSSVDSSTQPLSLREFLEDAGGKNNPAKIVTIASFMREYESQNVFSRDDIKGRFRSAGEPLPGNFPRDFQMAIQAGWIAEDHQNRGQYYVTRRGDEASQRKFEGSAPTITKPRRRRKVPPEHAPPDEKS